VIFEEEEMNAIMDYKTVDVMDCPTVAMKFLEKHSKMIPTFIFPYSSYLVEYKLTVEPDLRKTGNFLYTGKIQLVVSRHNSVWVGPDKPTDVQLTDETNWREIK
jgi:hypothetical protein